MSDVLDPVAFDIETTGLDVTEEVTVAGFAFPIGVRVFVQATERSIEDVTAVVQDQIDPHVNVSVHNSETRLLEALAEFVTERVRGEDVLLVAFNGETWNGGFDVPFLRSRYALVEQPWPFVDVPYADVYPLVKKLFNTTVDGEACNDLVSAYDTLCDGTISAADPFADSAEAVEAFRDGHVADIAVHNAVDVLRTQALARLAQRYCSKADFNLKSLTPVIQE